MFFRAIGSEYKWLGILAFALTFAVGSNEKTYAAPIYVCAGVCTPIIITDPTVPISPSTGKLVNILNVPIDGVLYDVAFVDGKFNDIFGAGVPALLFTTGEQAQKASQALSDTMIDVGDQFFDSTPALTRGCSNDQACLIMTPFELAISGAAFRFVSFVNDNPFLSQVSGDSVADLGGVLGARGQDFSLGAIFDDATFAVWRIAGDVDDDALNRFFTPPLFGGPASVDEPSAFGLLGLGLIFLSWMRAGTARRFGRKKR